MRVGGGGLHCRLPNRVVIESCAPAAQRARRAAPAVRCASSAPEGHGASCTRAPAVLPCTGHCVGKLLPTSILERRRGGRAREQLKPHARCSRLKSVCSSPLSSLVDSRPCRAAPRHSGHSMAQHAMPPIMGFVGAGSLLTYSGCPRGAGTGASPLHKSRAGHASRAWRTGGWREGRLMGAEARRSGGVGEQS